MTEGHDLSRARPGRQASDWSQDEIDAAIAGLDRASRSFSDRVNSLRRSEGARANAPTPPPRPSPSPAAVTGEESPRKITFDDRMSEAENEARQYLERAKRRADSLVNAMVSAVEHEAAEIRREAENGIRERWRKVEQEASGYLEQAQTVAERMVAERRHRISGLSDGVCARAETLTAGMDDAERVRKQFDMFVRALSETADQISRQPSEPMQGDIRRIRSLQGRGPEGVIAA